MAAQQVGAGGSVLDVATGPGYFCIELARLSNLRITGLDISDDLVEIARANARAAAVDVDFLEASDSGGRRRGRVLPSVAVLLLSSPRVAE